MLGQPPALGGSIAGMTAHAAVTDLHGGDTELSCSGHTEQQEKESSLWRFKKRGIICEALTGNCTGFQGLKIKSARLMGQRSLTLGP